MSNSKVSVVTDGKTPVKINGEPVIFIYQFSKKDFPSLTKRLMIDEKVPYTLAVCTTDNSLFGVTTYAKYGNDWFYYPSYTDLDKMIIAALLKQINQTKTNPNE